MSLFLRPSVYLPNVSNGQTSGRRFSLPLVCPETGGSNEKESNETHATLADGDQARSRKAIRLYDVGQSDSRVRSPAAEQHNVVMGPAIPNGWQGLAHKDR